MFKHKLAIAVLLTLSLPAVAQDDPVVWTGGIGIAERESAPKEGTKLVFFAEGGDFLSKVHVVIKDASGKEVVDAVSDGPWMILNLAPGSYSVHASVGDNAQGGRIEVSGGSQEFGYMFKL